ncbi:unnamed protein product [Cylindrotheca closterium]|uniref:Adaptor protein ClpS core domain-containing protein n=1 Tax=Cylindrotheca closterium TaxID=2856 RepID=A0AAD2FH28_9STRA|nr:unnamed protein product [Cylindrotheca closterium]
MMMNLLSKPFATVFVTTFLLLLASSSCCQALTSSPTANRISSIMPLYSAASAAAATTLAPEAPSVTKVTRTSTTAPTVTPDKVNDKSAEQSDFKGDGSLWEIRILDNDHHFDYQVAEILVKVAELSELQAFRAMRTAEKQGSCSIGEYDYEMAEHYTHALLDHQLGCEMNPLGFM